MSEQPHAKPIAESVQRVRVRYHGRVQGVGFRYSVQSMAAKYPVTGFVRNEWDGTVYVVAEGATSVLREWLGAIQASEVGRHIRDIEVRWDEPTGEFRAFRIEWT